MKKFVSLIISIMLVLNIVLLAFASGENLAENITLDLLTSQSKYAVTKSFSLNTDALLEVTGGNAVNWTSNSPAVVINGDKASVTRQEKDTEVNLTATVNGESKVITFTVPAKSTYIIESEGFGRPDSLGEKPMAVIKNWGEQQSVADPDYVNLIGDDNGNYVLDCFNNRTETKSYAYYTKHIMNDLPDSDRVKYEYSFTRKEASDYGQLIRYDMLFYLQDSTGKTDTYIGYTLSASNGKSAVTGVLNANGTKINGASHTHNNTNRIGIDFDFATETLDFYVDGVKKNTAPVSFAKDGVTYTGLFEVKFGMQRFSILGGNFYIDDVVVSTPKDTITVTTMDENEMGPLKVTTGITSSTDLHDSTNAHPALSVVSDYDEDRLIEHRFAEITTSNHIIDHLIPHLIDKESGARTQLANQAQDDTPSIQLSGLFYGANHGPMAIRLTFDGHGLDDSWVGTQWESESGEKWTLCKIDHKNAIRFMSDDFVSSTSWQHKNSMDGGVKNGTIKCLDTEEKYAGKELTFTNQQTGQMIFPITKNHVKTYTAYRNGEEIPLDIFTYEELNCDKLVMDETYILTDPRKLPELLRELKGEWTPEIGYALGEEIISYHQRIIVDEESSVIVELDHEILTDMANTKVMYIGYCYYPRYNLGGGTYRYIPGSKPFTYSGINYDFTTPNLIYTTGKADDYYAENYPNGYIGKIMWGEVMEDGVTPKITNRTIDYMRNADGSTAVAFASGFLPVGDRSYEKSPSTLATNESYYFYKSLKSYPLFKVQKELVKGDPYKGVVYRKFSDTERAGSDVSVYDIEYDGESYFFIDCLEAVDGKKITLPASFDADTAEVYDISTTAYAEIDYEISGNSITVTGDKNAYLVLKSNVKMVTIGETSCNIIGQAEASVKNSGTANVTVDAICAGYKEGKLVEINVKEITLAPRNSIVSFDGDYSEADTYKIMILDADGKIAPQTIKKSGKN